MESLRLSAGLVAALLAGLTFAIASRQSALASMLQARTAALVEREADYLALGDNLPDSYVYHYTHGADQTPRFLYVSAGVERVHGVKAAAVLEDAGALHGLIAPEQIPALRSAEAESLRTLADFSMEVRMRRTDGEWRWILIRSRPRRRPDGLVLWDGVVSDITERKRAETALIESQDRLAFALQASGTGGWDLDLVHHTAHRTLQHDRIFGYPALLPEWTYEMFLAHVIPEDRAEVDRLFGEAMARQSDWNFECRIRRADGAVRWIWATGGHRGPAGERPRRMAGIVQDITERKRAEETLGQMNTELERRVAERTAELRAANEELDGFAYAVSHDLRAPLRAMSGFSLALLEDYGERLTGEARRYLDQIRLASQNMGRLVDGLLALSRSTRGGLQREWVDLSALASRVCDELARSEPDRPVSWRVQEGLRAWADARMIEVVMRNLLGNAWKYTTGRAGARVEVSADREGDKVTWRVTDNGAGFDPRHADRLFKPFQRLHRQDEFPGIGIGLATVHRVIHRHGGGIDAMGSVGSGATFRFHLPSPEESGEEAS